MRAAQLKGKVPALPAPRPAGSTGHSITKCASHPSIHTTQVSSPGPTISGPRYQCTPATDSQANIRARQVASPQPLRLSNKSLQFRTHAGPCAQTAHLPSFHSPACCPPLSNGPLLLPRPLPPPPPPSRRRPCCAPCRCSSCRCRPPRQMARWLLPPPAWRRPWRQRWRHHLVPR